MSEARRISIGDRTYELASWAPADGDRWAFRLLQLLTVSAQGAKAPKLEEGDEATEGELSAGKLLERITPEDFLAFRDVAFKYTLLVEYTEDGEELVRELAKAREAMRGRYLDTLAILREHILFEFAPFLLSAGKIISGGSEASKVAGGSRSRRTSTG